jgi:hypothetical protein
MAQNDIPKNTYVGRSPSASVTKKAGLHAGAPLNQYRPRKIVETGMGTWMIALAGMLAIGMTMRMAKKSA